MHLVNFLFFSCIFHSKEINSAINSQSKSDSYFFQAGREDVGSYTCITSNVHGATETEMTVNVDCKYSEYIVSLSLFF